MSTPRYCKCGRRYWSTEQRFSTSEWLLVYTVHCDCNALGPLLSFHLLQLPAVCQPSGWTDLACAGSPIGATRVSRDRATLSVCGIAEQRPAWWLLQQGEWRGLRNKELKKLGKRPGLLKKFQSPRFVREGYSSCEKADGNLETLLN